MQDPDDDVQSSLVKTRENIVELTNEQVDIKPAHAKLSAEETNMSKAKKQLAAHIAEVAKQERAIYDANVALEEARRLVGETEANIAQLDATRLSLETIKVHDPASEVEVTFMAQVAQLYTRLSAEKPDRATCFENVLKTFENVITNAQLANGAGDTDILGGYAFAEEDGDEEDDEGMNDKVKLARKQRPLNF